LAGGCGVGVGVDKASWKASSLAFSKYFPGTRHSDVVR